MELDIVPYDPEWATAFQELSHTLNQALFPLLISIEHVGSTAIPGLSAKPILDIDIITLDRPVPLAQIVSVLESLGYESRGDQGIPGRYAFRQNTRFTPVVMGMPEWMAHHLYVCMPDSLALKNHLMFREALQSEPRWVKQYDALKKELMATPGMTRREYSLRKTDFILQVLFRMGMSLDELEQIRAQNQG